MEWVEDCYRETYEGAPTDGSAVIIPDCNERVLRGGSWFNLPDNVRSAVRLRQILQLIGQGEPGTA